MYLIIKFSFSIWLFGSATSPSPKTLALTLKDRSTDGKRADKRHIKALEINTIKI